MAKSQEQYIEHEVKLRLNDERFKLQDKNFNDLKHSFKELSKELHDQFKWTLGIMITLFGGLIITKFI